MIRLLLLRGVLIALPFAVWFAWAWWARRTGRTPPRAPYAWLFLAGMALMAVSLFGTALLSDDHRDDVYVPAEVLEDGRVQRGGFEDAQKAVEGPNREMDAR